MPAASSSSSSSQYILLNLTFYCYFRNTTQRSCLPPTSCRLSSARTLFCHLQTREAKARPPGQVCPRVLYECAAPHVKDKRPHLLSGHSVCRYMCCRLLSVHWTHRWGGGPPDNSIFLNCQECILDERWTLTRPAHFLNTHTHKLFVLHVFKNEKLLVSVFGENNAKKEFLK